MSEVDAIAAKHVALLARLVELRKPFEVLSNERPPFEELPDYIHQLGHCPECGPTQVVDEDGCCVACGADSMVYVDVAAMLVRIERLERELENCRLLAARHVLRDGISTDWSHILRFCSDGGIVGSILRGERS